jgi:hypothetical protein
MRIKHLTQFLIIAVVIIGVSCGKKGGTDDISGESSKIWKVSKIVGADGDKEKMDRDDKNDQMQFYADGTFTANTSANHTRGTWKHDESTKALVLQFENASVTQNYEIVELSDDKMRLKAGDGSEMIMDAAE